MEYLEVDCVIHRRTLVLDSHCFVDLDQVPFVAILCDATTSIIPEPPSLHRRLSDL